MLGPSRHGIMAALLCALWRRQQMQHCHSKRLRLEIGWALQVIIAGAGGAAHLPGMMAALTPLPVIGVPVKPAGAYLDGLDALLSIVQMPRGVPVATVAIGNAANAGLLAARILATHNHALQHRLECYQVLASWLVCSDYQMPAYINAHIASCVHDCSSHCACACQSCSDRADVLVLKGHNGYHAILTNLRCANCHIQAYVPSNVL